MKHQNFKYPCLFGIVLITALSITACADIPVNATPEIADLATSTTIIGEGIVTQGNLLAWEQSSTGLHDPPLDIGGLETGDFDGEWNLITGWTADPQVAEDLEESMPAGEVRYTTAYSSDTTAVQGATTLIKTVDVNTANKVVSASNINVNTLLAFDATSDGGRVTSKENLLIDGAGEQTTSASSASLCPFINNDNSFNPPFCNIVQMGSEIDVTSASISTSAKERFVSNTGSYPVTMDYSISGSGLNPGTGTSYALGSIGASMAAHLQEGLMLNITPYNPEAEIQPSIFVSTKSEDTTYSESSSATGTISRFAKSMHYQSGLSLVP